VLATRPETPKGPEQPSDFLSDSDPFVVRDFSRYLAWDGEPSQLRSVFDDF